MSSGVEGSCSADVEVQDPSRAGDVGGRGESESLREATSYVHLPRHLNNFLDMEKERIDHVLADTHLPFHYPKFPLSRYLNLLLLTPR